MEDARNAKTIQKLYMKNTSLNAIQRHLLFFKYVLFYN